MSIGKTKIPVPIVLFCFGIIPYILWGILAYLDLVDILIQHYDFVLLFIFIIFPTVSFISGFVIALIYQGKLWPVGAALNGLVLLSYLILMLWVI
jgi:hypothetical protein